MSSEYFPAKAVVVGESGVGKTSLIQRFISSSFDPDIEPSSRVSSSVKIIQVQGIEVKLSLWDTTGNEKYRSLGPIYYRGSIAGIIVYDITKKSTFDTVRFWATELRSHASNSISLSIVGNKLDRKAEREVTREEGESLAKDIKALFFEVSAKDESENDMRALFMQTIHAGLKERVPFCRHSEPQIPPMDTTGLCACIVI
eukprot:TRINITY_DN9793_c0_g1_i3.p1 TRINITY_DN9793_c0_g1~~TRINITY_DN9793_c0_g1_i3.p1  ORF type:complete len:200 (+),score=16.19 TRINITY_DN9793_c0_g1_i3:173-772(+)